MRSSISGLFSFISRSLPPHTSTSSSNNTMAPRASNSDAILHNIFSSLYGWLLALTQGSISVLRSSISRFLKFISVPQGISSSRRNTVGVLDPPRRLFGQDFIPSLHTLYAFLTGSLVTLMGIKYQGSGGDPFGEHPTLIMFFLIAISVYFIALITLRSNHLSDHASKLMLLVCHISGTLACELLLLVLVSPIKSLTINVSSLALIAMLALCYKYLSLLFHPDEGTEISETGGGEEQASKMVDLEAPTASTA